MNLRGQEILRIKVILHGMVSSALQRNDLFLR